MAMTFNSPVARIKIFRKKDPDWFWTTDGFTLVPRAAIQINDECPSEYQTIITECIDREWINPIAYVKESSYMWEKLKD